MRGFQDGTIDSSWKGFWNDLIHDAKILEGGSQTVVPG